MTNNLFRVIVCFVIFILYTGIVGAQEAQPQDTQVSKDDRAADEAKMSDRELTVFQILDTLQIEESIINEVLVVPNLSSFPSISNLFARNLIQNLKNLGLRNTVVNIFLGADQALDKRNDEILQEYIDLKKATLILYIEVAQPGIQKEDAPYDITLKILQSTLISEPLLTEKFESTLNQMLARENEGRDKVVASASELVSRNIEALDGLTILKVAKKNMRDNSIAAKRINYEVEIDKKIVETNAASIGLAYFPKGKYQVKIFQVAKSEEEGQEAQRTLVDSFKSEATATEYLRDVDFSKSIKDKLAYSDIFYPILLNINFGFAYETGDKATDGISVHLQAQQPLGFAPLYFGLGVLSTVTLRAMVAPLLEFGYMNFPGNKIRVNVGLIGGFKMISAKFEILYPSYYTFVPTFGVTSTARFSISRFAFVSTEVLVLVANYQWGTNTDLSAQNRTTGVTTTRKNYEQHKLTTEDPSYRVLINPSVGIGWRF